MTSNGRISLIFRTLSSCIGGGLNTCKGKEKVKVKVVHTMERVKEADKDLVVVKEVEVDVEARIGIKMEATAEVEVDAIVGMQIEAACSQLALTVEMLVTLH